MQCIHCYKCLLSTDFSTCLAPTELGTEVVIDQQLSPWWMTTMEVHKKKRRPVQTCTKPVHIARVQTGCAMHTASSGLCMQLSAAKVYKLCMSVSP